MRRPWGQIQALGWKSQNNNGRLSAWGSYSGHANLASFSLESFYVKKKNMVFVKPLLLGRGLLLHATSPKPGLPGWLSGKELTCQCCSVTQSRPTLCDPMDYSMLGFPVFHHLLEFTQTHVHWGSDTIQPSHPLSSPFPAFNISQHQGLDNESTLHIR